MDTVTAAARNVFGAAGSYLFASPARPFHVFVWHTNTNRNQASVATSIKSKLQAGGFTSIADVTSVPKKALATPSVVFCCSTVDFEQARTFASGALFVVHPGSSSSSIAAVPRPNAGDNVQYYAWDSADADDTPLAARIHKWAQACQFALLLRTKARQLKRGMQQEQITSTDQALQTLNIGPKQLTVNVNVPSIRLFVGGKPSTDGTFGGFTVKNDDAASPGVAVIDAGVASDPDWTNSAIQVYLMRLSTFASAPLQRIAAWQKQGHNVYAFRGDLSSEQVRCILLVAMRRLPVTPHTDARVDELVQEVNDLVDRLVVA